MIITNNPASINFEDDVKVGNGNSYNSFDNISASISTNSTSNSETSSTSKDSTFSLKKDDHSSAEQVKVNKIREMIRAEDRRLRKKYSILSLKNQDSVGTAIYICSLFALFVASDQWYRGNMSGFTLCWVNALILSIFHEMEHDIIHNLYFKRREIVQHMMFFGIWILKSNAAPWWRKYYHLRHHQESGQETDVEERLIGLGMKPWSIKRILVTLTPAATLFVAHDIKKDVPDFSILGLILANAPTVGASTLSVIFHGLYSINDEVFSILAPIIPFCIIYNYTLNFPNFLRQSCLIFVSTFCHYYGDIPEKDVFYQTQILDHWMLYPFQLFCFNFGATHIIHHFVTRQPFYLRQLTAFKVIPEMIKAGCRYNDIFNQNRANRFTIGDDTPKLIVNKID